MDQAANKKALRAHLSEVREAVSPDVRTEASAALIRLFLAQVPYDRGDIVAGFFPIGSEIDVLPLLAELRTRGIVICLPVTRGRDEPLIFREFTGDEELVPVGFGCQAPDVGARELEPDTVLMPLLGFDRKGNRLGYGGGFYDRTLAGYDVRPLCVGAAFACQEVEALPKEAHDIKMDMLLSEDGVKDWRKPWYLAWLPWEMLF